MKNAVIGLGSVALVAVVAWLLLFGATDPCTALGTQAAPVVARQPPSARPAITDALAGLAVPQCAALAVRLRFGDESAIQVRTVGR
jgi:hypothetical protein